MNGLGPILGASALALTAVAAGAARPNVLIVMPDDLSYDDYSSYNARGPRTPNVDALGRESVRLTDFHVAPSCSPSRAQLMTGRSCDATGVWHTFKGRELLRADEVTMADVFRANGYRTALIGKWHLGDSYPFRPEDRGFEHTAMILGGGIDQEPNPWGDTNDAPSTLFVDGRPVPLADGGDGIPGAFSTNFFTDRAIGFMRRCAAEGSSFFLYLPYNVAHDPPDMPPDARPGIDAHTATVENLDKNVGRLLRFLRRSGLGDDTLLIFILGDNGMSNAYLRGGKTSEYEGGHRVPCFVRWRDGGLGGDEAAAREMSRLSSEIDVLPTLMDLLGLHDVADRPPEAPIEGRSLRPYLEGGRGEAARRLWGRTLVVDDQRTEDLEKYRQACVMRDGTDAEGRIVHKWRLIRESASDPWRLYDLVGDLKERRDLAARPGLAEVVTSMRASYEAWWSSVSARAGDYCRAVLGSEAEPEVCLYSQDWHGPAEGNDAAPWSQGMVAAGLRSNGFSAVQFAAEPAKGGAWRFELRRWPREIADETALTSTLRTPIAHGYGNGGGPTLGVALPIRSARIRIWDGGKTYADLRRSVDPQAGDAVFEVAGLPAGPAMVQTWFYDGEGRELCGAYYDYVAYVHP